ncbi:glycosyltransferase [Paracoccus aestuarii]|uniref:Glycosyltransferase n=1 Tax=Paracoccus aestuarii TaxID=453842 RepID=A0A418ZU01_9RHOB|nr:glycosyltransferase family 4 protein [Paracoccus aestuarii]RJL01850.1 glycosyltransferase [Paracoccus aestuarii]WCR00853.1 glycosyltransferase family 4 protein [Paracoccus aestuarii]
MRIAYVCTDPGIPVFGTKGASIHVQEMLRAFLAHGAEVALITPRAEGTPPADLAAVTLHPLPPLPKGDGDLRAAAALAQNGLVHAALDGLGPLDLVYERHALHAHGAMEWAQGRACPGILEVNAPLIEEQARHRSLSLPREAEDSARRAMRAAEIVAAVSPAVAAHCSHMGAPRVEVVPNGVTPDRFPERPAPDGPFTIGFLGGLRPWHDVDTAIAALALLRAGRVPDARLLIVGDGPERPRLEDLARDLGVAEAIELTGALPPDQVPAQLARMHVGTAPYAARQDFYFSPLKLHEYMAAGLAVVASRVGHLPQMIDEGRTGLLTPPGDAAALADALAGLAADPVRRADLGRRARAHVLAHHSWHGVAARLLSWAGLAGRAAA